MEASEVVERIWMENESHQFEYGTDLVVHVYVTFLGKSLHENTIRSHIFHIQGPSTGEDFELLEFTLQTPPREAFVPPQRICADLVPGNNNAELFDVSSFPLRTNSKYVQIQTKSEYSNKYFAITGREFVSRDPELSVDENWSFLGISWNIPPSCVRAKATYRFRAKVRVHSESPITIKWNVKGWEGRRPVFAQVALCPPSQGEWVQCSGSIIAFPNEIVHSHRLEMLAETLETFRHNYDVDDLSFELMEGPVDRLLLPSSIHQKWLTGAHLLITSSTPEWDEWEVVEIKDVAVHDSDSVKVEISRPIKSPVTARESDVYSTEVALLSRNIVFENGGHFTVLRTPGVAQVIEGADFSRFGIAGRPGRHPIYFDNCWDAEGTIVSKNTIRHSRHRGLVLHATSNVRVTSNVAFNTTGDCFVLESGIEQGNSFENNLAAFTTTEMPRVTDRGDDKSDDHPAAFWISNPANDFIGNVATGTDGSGFSFQFDASPLGHRVMDEFGIPVNTLNLGAFENNIVHSVNSFAVHFSGYRPHKAKIAGLRAFLIDGDLFELVNSDRITIVNGTFDKEVNSATGLSFESPSIIDVRGCIDGDDEAIATMNALVDEGKREPAMLTPSAPSVFGLQEIDL
jgi:parallel beta-helix repeat protein